MQFTGIIKKAGVLPLLALTLALGLTACSKAPAQAAESMSHPAVQQTAESASQPAHSRRLTPPLSQPHNRRLNPGLYSHRPVRSTYTASSMPWKKF